MYSIVRFWKDIFYRSNIFLRIIMSLNQKTVLGIPITISNSDDILEEVIQGLNRQRKIPGQVITIFTPNPEIVAYAQNEEKFKEIVVSAQINIPDGWGISWALRRLYDRNVPRLSGVDFMKILCQKSEELGFRIGILGGRSGVALKAKECLLAQFPRLDVETMEIGEIGQPSLKLWRVKEIGVMGGDRGMRVIDDIVEQVMQKNIRIVFVALGFPKQEYVIERIRYQVSGIRRHKPLVLMAVGGSLDYLSGAVPRAPHWLRERGGEWFYRLLREPWRLGRQIRGLGFFWHILRSHVT